MVFTLCVSHRDCEHLSLIAGKFVSACPTRFHQSQLAQTLSLSQVGAWKMVCKQELKYPGTPSATNKKGANKTNVRIPHTTRLIHMYE